MCRCADVQVFRCADVLLRCVSVQVKRVGVQVYWFAGVHMCRCANVGVGATCTHAGVQAYRCTGVQVYMCAGVHVYRYSCFQVCM